MLGLNMNSRLIGSGLSDCPSSRVRARVKRYRSHEYFNSRITNCSAITILSLGITSRQLRPTNSFFGDGGLTSLQRYGQHIQQPNPTGWLSSRVLFQVLRVWLVLLSLSYSTISFLRLLYLLKLLRIFQFQIPFLYHGWRRYLYLLVSLFNGILTFMDYSMPESFLKKNSCGPI